MTPTDLVVVGAGPIGLAAAAHAAERGLTTVVLEAGPAVGSAVRDWGHVRLFSPWRELLDTAAVRLLGATGWTPPDPDAHPTGAEWVTDYLDPLADVLVATGSVDVRVGHRVAGLARSGRDRLVDSGRDEAPFVVHVVATADTETRLLARAVVDASGTWGRPAPLGGDGLPALGEVRHGDRIGYGIPDLTDPVVQDRFRDRHVAVAGTGASAQNVLVGLVGPGGAGAARVSWLVRRPGTDAAFGGGDADELRARGALGNRARDVVAAGPVDVVASFRTSAVEQDPAHPDRVRLVSTEGAEVAGVDEVVVVTGLRPDLDWLGEVRLDLDPVLSAPSRLAPLIDPNEHSCGTVEPHGADVLEQPERGLYLAGMKSYGRAPSFLALTGFEQVRSIVAAVAGDHEAAQRVELVLPDSGVCGGAGAFDDPSAQADGACCGTAPELVTVGAPPESSTP
jgi:hypothetical protein